VAVSILYLQAKSFGMTLMEPSTIVSGTQANHQGAATMEVATKISTKLPMKHAVHVEAE
jgi:hypothetical protein